MIVNKLKGVRYMLDFVHNRKKVMEIMAEDALATMELLEKVKADTKHLGSFAGDGLLMDWILFLTRLKRLRKVSVLSLRILMT